MSLSPAEKARRADRRFFTRNQHRCTYVRRQFPGEFDGVDFLQEAPRADANAGQATFAVVKWFGENYRAVIPAIGPAEYSGEDVGEERAAALFSHLLAVSGNLLNLVFVEEGADVGSL